MSEVSNDRTAVFICKPFICAFGELLWSRARLSAPTEVEPKLTVTVESDYAIVPTWKGRSAQGWRELASFVVGSNYSNTQYPQCADPCGRVTQFHTYQRKNNTTGTLRGLGTLVCGFGRVVVYSRQSTTIRGARAAELWIYWHIRVFILVFNRPPHPHLLQIFVLTLLASTCDARNIGPTSGVEIRSVWF